MDDDPLILARDVHKWYGDNHVLKGMDLLVNQGEIISIIGPSGSGKSTFLRCINHLEERDAGEIFVDGKLVGYEYEGGKVFRQTEELIARARRDCGMVFQHFELFHHMRVLDNVTYFPLRVAKRSKKDAVALATHLLERVGLVDKAHAYPSELSGGQQQRIAIARALAMEPKIMLFDEPTSALDPQLVGEVLRVIKDLADEGMTMVIVTHEIQFARQISDVVVFMKDGIAVERGTPTQVIDESKEQETREFLSTY